MYKLRPYQEEAVKAGTDFFLNGKAKGGLLILPTGSGKSLVIASIAKSLPGNTIVFQPSKEILEQNYAKIKSYGVDDVSIYSASVGEKKIDKITFATIGSVIKKTDLFKHFNNIIIDECHGVNAEGDMYQKFIWANGGRVLGLTATPYRLTSFGREIGRGKYENVSMLKFLTRSRPRIFEKVLHYTQIPDLYEEGFLAKLKYFDVDCIRPANLKKNTSGSDFDDTFLQKHLQEVQYVDRVVQVVNRLLTIGRKKILVFTKFVSDADSISKLIPCSCMVSGDTKKRDREEILSAFHDMNNPLQVVLNVGVLTTGFDFPELDTVVLARPTMSLGLYYQMTGRGIRPHPGKDHCMVVDMAQVTKRFGPVEQLRVDNLGGEKWVVQNGSGKVLTNVILE